MSDLKKSQEEDVRLVREIEQCSEEAFNRLYKKYSHRVRQTVGYRIPLPQDAEDVRQEIWRDIYRKCKSKEVRNPERIAILIMQISRNKVNDYWRKKYGETGPVQGPGKTKGKQVPFDEENLDHGFTAINLDDILDLMRCLEKLKPSEMSLLDLYYNDGYSWRELSSKLQENEATLRMQASRAREKLRDCMEIGRT